MSFSLYVTRRRHRHDARGPAIALAEWQALVAADPDLQFDTTLGAQVAVWRGPSAHALPWIGWDDGDLEAKQPDAPLTGKLVAIAAVLGARVVGEDGESYAAAGQPPVPPPPERLSARLSAWLAGLRARIATAGDPPGLPFRTGARVRTIRGRTGTVTAIDLKADHGLGAITVAYDDGLTERHAAVGHGLEPMAP